METKNFGEYKLRHKFEFEKKTGDYILLYLHYSDELRELIKRAIVDEETVEETSLGTYKRYKVKGTVYSGLYGNYKWALFLKDLIDSGKTVIKLPTPREAESALHGIRESLQECVRILLKYDGYESTMTINISGAKK